LSKSKLIIIGVVSLLSVWLFAKGYKSKTKTVQSTVVTSQSATFDIVKYIDGQHEQAGSEVAATSKQLQEAADKQSIQELVKLWDTIAPLVAAHYFSSYAEMESTENNWYVLGTKYLNISTLEFDSLTAKYALAQAKSAFSKALDINPANLAAKTGLATATIELDGEVMKGVTMLREVLEADSNQAQAIYTLGVLSMRSEQYDKAIQRFEKLTRLQPFNAENYFYLAEAYARYGDVKSAMASYEKCKTLLNDKEAKKEIDKIIQQLKNI
jgi:tetratricopeptide (TPR) repeat protein